VTRGNYIVAVNSLHVTHNTRYHSTDFHGCAFVSCSACELGDRYQDSETNTSGLVWIINEIEGLKSHRFPKEPSPLICVSYKYYII